MWDSNQNESTNTYQRNTEWFAGPFDTPVNKPPAIIKWEQNTTCYEPINKFFARLRAINQLEDLSTIAMTFTKKEVKTRFSFETNEHGQSVAPTVFALDPNGNLLLYANELRQERKSASDSKDSKKSLELALAKQEERMNEWIKHADGCVEESDKKTLLHYVDLTDSEFLYVQELVRVYDHARCYFVQWVVDSETKAIINGARLAAVHTGKEYTWENTELDILQPLVDISIVARLMSLLNEKRPHGSLAQLWVAGRIAIRAILEDTKAPERLVLGETIYLTLMVGQMSDNELNLMKIPAIGDELYAKEADNKPTWTLLRIKTQVQGCMKPPKYKGANTPVTKLLEKQTKISQSNFKNDRHQSDTQRKERKPEKYEKKNTEPKFKPPRQQYTQTGDNFGKKKKIRPG